ncbi:MAG: acetyl-CoA carboxylase biotin carboxyl carrier protein [Alphaproteobacteria bacterium]|nr:acetyl-CoA carboxylase biotin carboxyl carrier protein [Alphaproteobacteria bacterium]
MSSSLDTKVIGKLAEILDKNNLTGIEYEDEGCHITLSRNFQGIATTVAVPNIQTVSPVAPIATPDVSATTSSSSETVTTNNITDDYSNNPNTIKSPMVGVVYLSPDPNSPNYVKPGDSVKEGDIVCLIEAMKTFNPVKAHKSGTVSKILVEGGDPVEYGEPLVVIE